MDMEEFRSILSGVNHPYNLAPPNSGAYISGAYIYFDSERRYTFDHESIIRVLFGSKAKSESVNWSVEGF